MMGFRKVYTAISSALDDVFFFVNVIKRYVGEKRNYDSLDYSYARIPNKSPLFGFSAVCKCTFDRKLVR